MLFKSMFIVAVADSHCEGKNWNTKGRVRDEK